MYLLVLSLPNFIAIFVFNEQQIFAFILITVEVLQIGALTYVTSSFPLLYLLLLVINAHYKCTTYLGFDHY